MIQTSDPIPFFGGELRIINATEQHTYSDVCVFKTALQSDVRMLSFLSQYVIMNYRTYQTP